MASLVDKSFMRYTPDGRYEIHELMRQYGAARLIERPDEERGARDDHARYYLILLEHQAAPLRGARQRQILERLAPEIENIKTAWNWSVTRHRLDWIARMLPGWLWLFEIRNDFEGAAAALLHAVESFRSQGAPASLANPDERDNFAFLLSQAGWFAFRCGQTERGRALIDEALALVDPGGSPETLWYAKANRGFIEVGISNLDEARRFTQQALEHARELANSWHYAWPLAILGAIDLEEGNPQSSFDRLHESLALWKEIGDPRGLVFTYMQLGATTLTLGKNEEALKYAEQSLAVSVSAHDRWSQANALNLIDQALAAQGHYGRAWESFRESVRLYREVGDLWGAAQALVNLGSAALDAGEGEQAKVAFLEALPAAEESQAVATGLSALVGLARLEVEGNRPDWVYSLASYVAGHPQASEYNRDAARQVGAAIKGHGGVRGTVETDDRFQGRTFEEVVNNALFEIQKGGG